MVNGAVTAWAGGFLRQTKINYMPVSRQRAKKNNIQTVYSAPQFIKTGTRTLTTKEYTRADGTVKKSRQIVKNVYKRNPDAKPIGQVRRAA